MGGNPYGVDGADRSVGTTSNWRSRPSRNTSTVDRPADALPIEQADQIVHAGHRLRRRGGR